MERMRLRSKLFTTIRYSIMKRFLHILTGIATMAACLLLIPPVLAQDTAVQDTTAKKHAFGPYGAERQMDDRTTRSYRRASCLGKGHPCGTQAIPRGTWRTSTRLARRIKKLPRRGVDRRANRKNGQAYVRGQKPERKNHERQTRWRSGSGQAHARRTPG